MDAVIALTRLGGVATHAELVDAVGRSALNSAVRAGFIARRATDTYAVAEADEAATAAVRLQGALGLTSAALAYGWKVKTTPQRPTVWVPRNRKVTPDRYHGVDLRWGSISQHELDARRTTPERTVVDCARFLPFDEALAVADSALREGDVGPMGLLAAAEAAPRTGRARAIRVATEATHEADNPMESVLRAICLDIPGLAVTPQYQVGTIGRSDLVDSKRRLVVEAESMEHHGSRSGYRRDVRRYTQMVRAQYLVLRFCWEDIMVKPEEVTATIRDVMMWWPCACRREVRRNMVF